MEDRKIKINVKELLSPNIGKDCASFLEILEVFDTTMPTRESALVVKNAIGVHKDPVMSFLLKKSFRLAAFKLKGTKFNISLSGLEKLLHSPDRLDDLALAITSVNKAEAFMASDYFKSANWKEYPTEILPCFCTFFKNHGNSQDLDDILELTRHPNAIVVAAAVEAIKKLDTGSLRSIIEPLIKKKTESQALDQLYLSSLNYDSSDISQENEKYYKENHKLLMKSLKDGTSDLEIIRILRLIKKYGTPRDAEKVRPLLNKDKPDVVRAAIKVLVKLDSEYLCLYLPQLLQDKNLKIRLTATRAFQSIDNKSVENIVMSLLSSANVKQRGIAITIGMLVDFYQVRAAYLQAFSNETSQELLEKIGLVFAANPDRDLLKDLYFYHRNSKSILKEKRESIIKLVSEKISISLNEELSAEELIKEASLVYEEKLKAEPQNASNQFSKELLENNRPILNSKNINGVHQKQSQYQNKVTTFQDSERQSILDRLGWNSIGIKGKIVFLMYILIPLLWGLVIVALIVRFFF